jgi:predicted RNase H-like nuclease (RuvC/YqgF family)
MSVGEDMYLYILFALKTRLAFLPSPTVVWNWRSQSQNNSMFQEETFPENGQRTLRRLRHLMEKGGGVPPVPQSGEAAAQAMEKEMQQVKAERERLERELREVSSQLAERDRLERELRDARRQLAERDRLEKELQETSSQLADFKVQVHELQSSRWRKLGRRLGIAKPTSFERSAA